MRVLHLVNEVVDTGNGIVNVAVDLACVQARAGHEVHVASAGGGHLEVLERHGVRHHELDFALSAGLVRTVPRLRALERGLLPDVVHAHTLAPVLVHRAAATGVPLVATVHNEYQRGVSVMAVADRVVGVSDAVSASMRRVARRRGQVVSVLNGVLGSPRRTPLAELEPVDLGGRSIVAVGATTRRKGVDVLLEAFRRLADTRDDLHLWFVGNHDWEEFLEDARTGAHADRVHLPGMDRQPARYLLGATVFVLASRREPFGLVITEARECGVPVVASDVEGIPEALDGGAAGVLVPPGDPAALAAAIGEVLDDEGRRAELSHASLLGVDRFTVEAMADRYDDVYRDVLSTRRSRRRP